MLPSVNISDFPKDKLNNIIKLNAAEREQHKKKGYLLSDLRVLLWGDGMQTVLSVQL